MQLQTKVKAKDFSIRCDFIIFTRGKIIFFTCRKVLMTKAQEVRTKRLEKKNQELEKELTKEVEKIFDWILDLMNDYPFEFKVPIPVLKRKCKWCGRIERKLDIEEYE